MSKSCPKCGCDMTIEEINGVNIYLCEVCGYQEDYE